MASKQRDDGIVGGEMVGEGCGPECGWQPPQDGAHMGDRLDDDAHSYLGHFRKPENARKGHNCVDM